MILTIVVTATQHRCFGKTSSRNMESPSKERHFATHCRGPPLLNSLTLGFAHILPHLPLGPLFCCHVSVPTASETAKSKAGF